MWKGGRDIRATAPVQGSRGTRHFIRGLRIFGYAAGMEGNRTSPDFQRGH